MQNGVSKKKNFTETVYRWILVYGIPLFALAVVSLNASLIFDNVVWGDEAFSGNIIRGTDFAGIYQRVYYWENHPPLYYFYLKIWTLILGDRTWVLHLASVVPFAGGIVLAMTYVRKHLGAIPAVSYALFTGLSATCAEYNQEIRMYELCFLFMLLAAYFAWRVCEDSAKGALKKVIPLWGGLVLAGVAAAYTHYYGLVSSGLLLFVTGVVYFIRRKGKTWLFGVLSIAAYLVLYTPWLSVLFRQITYVKGSWWMDAPDGPKLLIDFVFGGGKLKYIFLAFVIAVTVFAVVAEVMDSRMKKACTAAEGQEGQPVKGPAKGLSTELRAMIIYWLTIALTVTFAYVASAVFKPILVNRYMHPIIPLMLFAMMAAVKRIVRWGAEGKEKTPETSDEGKTTEKDVEKPEGKGILQEEYLVVKNKRGRIVVIALIAAWCIMLVPALLDFKYYRSVSRSEEMYTAQTLQVVGTPGENTVFTSLGVQHLAWTVLQYYYPDSEVYNLDPSDLETDADEIWAFMGYEMNPETIGIMTERGYKWECWPDANVAKYPCLLYHFTKTETEN